ncbi:MAG: alpha/beta fold hydrolase [Sandaracinaceae bacterium]
MSRDRPAPLDPALPGERFDVDLDGFGRLQAYGAGPAGQGASAEPVLLVHSVNAAASAFEVRALYTRLADSRPVYGFDLPGFGLSERPGRLYTPRLMTDAVHAVVDAVRARHGGVPVHALGLSLSSEYVARAAVERPDDYRTLALVSPTGFDSRGRREGPEGANRGMGWLRSALTCGLWDDGLFGLLTKPGVVRYFLRRTWGSKEIDEDVWAYAVATARQPGAKHAPLSFLSGHLFSADISRVYDALRMPVWMSHGVRGDFVDYRGVDAVEDRDNWSITVFDTGALPHVEVPDPFVQAYATFLGGGRPSV